MHNIINAQSIMNDYAVTTGLAEGSVKPRRYLWTDAFAVCNYLGLYQQTHEDRFLQLALKLVEEVHYILGRPRDITQNQGWLSGLEEQQARLHPTAGGLRIGKQLDERQPGEPLDEALEWERDGQYFHYLTKWMHALNRVSQVTSDSLYNQWALELAKVAHDAFTYTSPTGEIRMVWKMSTDLSRPQIASMGQHDPLDGLITYLQLQAIAKQFPETPPTLHLKTELDDMVSICHGRSWFSEDALGIGGLLTDAYILVQLIVSHHRQETVLLEALLNDAENSLQAFARHNPLKLSAEYRLAFRELGLAIGLHTISRMQQRIAQHADHFTNVNQLNDQLTRLDRWHATLDSIENFWLEARHRQLKSWYEHADINHVMLATCLLPDGYLSV